MTDALLRQVLAEVRELRADVAALATMQLGRGERELLAALLPAAAQLFADRAFTTRDVCRWPTLRPLVHGLTPSALSWTFARSERVTLGEWRVRRIGTDRDGAVWQLVRQVVTSAPASGPACVPMDSDTDNPRG